MFALDLKVANFLYGFSVEESSNILFPLVKFYTFCKNAMFISSCGLQLANLSKGN